MHKELGLVFLMLKLQLFSENSTVYLPVVATSLAPHQVCCTDRVNGPPPDPRSGPSVEMIRSHVRLGSGVTLILFSFQHQQNRNRMWWQILLFLHNLALNGDENRNGAGPR